MGPCPALGQNSLPMALTVLGAHCLSWKIEAPETAVLLKSLICMGPLSHMWKNMTRDHNWGSGKCTSDWRTVGSSKEIQLEEEVVAPQEKTTCLLREPDYQGWNIQGSHGCWGSMRLSLTWLCLAISPMCWDTDCCVNKMTCTTKDLKALPLKSPLEGWVRHGDESTQPRYSLCWVPWAVHFGQQSGRGGDKGQLKSVEEKDGADANPGQKEASEGPSWSSTLPTDSWRDHKWRL